MTLLITILKLAHGMNTKHFNEKITFPIKKDVIISVIANLSINLNIFSIILISQITVILPIVIVLLIVIMSPTVILSQVDKICETMPPFLDGYPGFTFFFSCLQTRTFINKYPIMKRFTQ